MTAATSLAAYDSVKPHLTKSQAEVKRTLAIFGSGSDEAIAARAMSLGYRQSPSGFRTRRAELVAKNEVRDTGRTTITNSGRKTVVWALVT